MFESVGVNGSDFIDVKVQFWCLSWDPIGNLFQLGVAASDHRSRACTLRRAIIVPQATLGIVTYKKRSLNIQFSQHKEYQKLGRNVLNSNILPVCFKDYDVQCKKYEKNEMLTAFFTRG